MQIIHRLTLDTKKQGIQAAIPLTANDSASHILIFDFCGDEKNVSIPEGSTAVFYALKPDGSEIMNSCVCYGENGAYPNTVVYTVTPETSAMPGRVNARLIVSDESTVYYSPRFELRVEDNEFLDADIASSSEYTELRRLIEDAAEYKDCAEAWACGKIKGTDVDGDAPQYENNAKYYAELSAKNSVTTDNEMSDSSDNPVKNRVIKKFVEDLVATAVTGVLNTPV